MTSPFPQFDAFLALHLADGFPSCRHADRPVQPAVKPQTSTLNEALAESLGLAPALRFWFWLAMFLAASFLMVWRLERLTTAGLEGTVLGTLIMPYCSGFANVVFVFVVVHQGAPAGEVVVNALVNNVTNLTLLLGLAALAAGLIVVPNRKGRARERNAFRLNRLSLLLSLAAVFFFGGAAWALALDGTYDRADGFVLIGLFVFWQTFHVYEVLKTNLKERRSLPAALPLEFLILLVAAAALYLGVEGVVAELLRTPVEFLGPSQLGWITGWIMVLPNALLACYFAWRRRADIVYSSQIGDNHICIPLCLGLIAVLQPAAVPGYLQTGLILVSASAVVHAAFILFWGGLPRWAGAALVLAYGYFLYAGLVK